MTITEFARNRGQQAQTISRYISRHDKEFAGHTKKVGKAVELDDAAIALLDSAYPIPKPVTVINGVPEADHLQALARKDEQIQQLQSKIISMQEQLNVLTVESADLKAKALLLEDKDKQLQREQERADQSEQELKKYKKTIFGLYKKDK